jgi:hypothetical protein
LFKFYLVQGMAKVGTNALCAKVLRTRANCFANAKQIQINRLETKRELSLS